ncbi:MAG: hypothetical protein M0P10_06455 [Sphaerochaetaceae bacterium]|nr:hypothetical protein [Sphaerochaetaceae bacterium]
MVDFKDIYIKIFREVRDDEKILRLLEIEPLKSDASPTDKNNFLKKLKTQIIDTANPGDMLNDYSSKLCVHESDGSYRSGVEDYGYISIDIHTTQDKDAIDRRHLKIMQRLIEILDSNERVKAGKEKLNIGLEGLVYKSRPSQTNVSTGWEKHTVLFEYKFLTNIF